MAVTKKSSSKKTKKSIATKKPEATNTMPSTSSVTTPLSITISKEKMIIGALVLVLAALLFFFRGLFVVAMVNGKPITRLALISELENQTGQQTLDALITEELILQEAAEQGVSVPQEELDAEIELVSQNLEAQGQTLEQALTFQGLSLEDLTEQIRIQKLLEQILLSDAAITEEEIAEFIETNRENFPETTSEEELQDAAKQQLTQQKLSELVQPWLGELRQNANIQYWAPQFEQVTPQL